MFVSLHPTRALQLLHLHLITTNTNSIHSIHNTPPRPLGTNATRPPPCPPQPTHFLPLRPTRPLPSPTPTPRPLCHCLTNFLLRRSTLPGSEWLWLACSLKTNAALTAAHRTLAARHRGEHPAAPMMASPHARTLAGTALACPPRPPQPALHHRSINVSRPFRRIPSWGSTWATVCAQTRDHKVYFDELRQVLFIDRTEARRLAPSLQRPCARRSA